MFISAPIQSQSNSLSAIFDTRLKTIIASVNAQSICVESGLLSALLIALPQIILGAATLIALGWVAPVTLESVKLRGDNDIRRAAVSTLTAI
jgi:hypothetical protein